MKYFLYFTKKMKNILSNLFYTYIYIKKQNKKTTQNNIIVTNITIKNKMFSHLYSNVSKNLLKTKQDKLLSGIWLANVLFFKTLSPYKTCVDIDTNNKSLLFSTIFMMLYVGSFTHITISSIQIFLDFLIDCLDEIIIKDEEDIDT